MYGSHRHAVENEGVNVSDGSQDIRMKPTNPTNPTNNAFA
jgi:hypothetical protein